MEINNEAVCGTVQSNDCLVRVGKADEKTVLIKSTVLNEFGEQIRAVIDEVLSKKGLTKILVEIDDHGALDCTIRARLETAIERARGTR